MTKKVDFIDEKLGLLENIEKVGICFVTCATQTTKFLLKHEKIFTIKLA